jgi:hypothetical protein
MHRTDAPNHAANLFVDSDPVGGTPGTVVDDDWLNAVQEELVAAIQASGITLAKGTNTQLRDAIKRLYGGFVTTVDNGDSPKTLGVGEAGLVLVDASAGSVTINLPSASALPGLRYRLVRTDAGGNAVTINRDGADLFWDGSTSQSLAVKSARLGITADGVSSWFPSQAAPALPRGHISGLGLSNNGADAAHDIDIAVGMCRDDGDQDDLVLAAALTKQIDAAWSVGDAAGGLDTGAVAANQTYHKHLIKRSDTGVVDALFSLSASAPTMPASYDRKRRLGAVMTDGSANIVAFLQDGDRFILDSPVQDYSVANPGTAAVLRALSVPTGIELAAIMTSGISFFNSDGNIVSVMVSDPAQPAVTPNSAKYTQYLPGWSGGSRNNVALGEFRTNASGQVRTQISYSVANVLLEGITHGWIDTRGKEA